eukprot:Gb_10024 [translate_table: standard]
MSSVSWSHAALTVPTLFCLLPPFIKRIRGAVGSPKETEKSSIGNLDTSKVSLSGRKCIDLKYVTKARCAIYLRSGSLDKRAASEPDTGCSLLAFAFITLMGILDACRSVSIFVSEGIRNRTDRPPAVKRAVRPTRWM